MNKRGNSVERNAVILFFAEVMPQALGLGVTILIARMLGVENYGLLSFAYSLSTILLVVPKFGFDQLAVREIARRPSRAKVRYRAST